MTSETGIPWIPSLPSSWSVQRAKTLLFRSKSLNSDRGEKQVLSLTLRGVVDNDPDNPEGLVPEDYATYQLFEPDDLVFKLIDLENVRTSRVGLVPKRGIMSSAYLRLRPRPDVCVGFLYWSFFDLYNRRIFNHLGNGVRSTLSADDVLNLPLPVPPLALQHAIADYLDAETARIDALIAKKQQMIELSGLRWRGHLLEAVAPHLCGSRVPDHWMAGRLRNFVDRVVGGSWGAEPGEGAVDKPCVRAADFDFQGLSAAGGAIRSYGLSEMQTRLVRRGDLIIEKSGGGEESPVGRVVMWVDDRDAVPTNFAARLRPLDSHDPWFVLLTFRAAYEAGLNWRSIKQTTGIQNLDTGAYLAEPWPIPKLVDQQRISSEVRARLDSTIALRQTLQRQIDLLREHRQALITAAVTGELDIPGVAA